MFEKDALLKQSSRPDSPHNIIPHLIRPHTSVLDVGCNTGYLAQNLKTKNVITDGIDINDRALEVAKKYCRKTYKRDLYQPFSIDERKYDYIVFSDILEHLPRPDLVLISSQKYLKKQGQIIASIPNVARFEIRLKLLFGTFDYSPGIMSPDHLRFFTNKSATELMNKSGYSVLQTIPTGLGYYLHVFPTLTAFQFVFICQRSDP